jgi:exopolysaccharide biosynthesis polyprenyl glycosylphosphotransferase
MTVEDIRATRSRTTERRLHTRPPRDLTARRLSVGDVNEFVVPQQALWFVDAARRPLARSGGSMVIDLDRRTTALIAGPTPSATAESVHRLSKRIVDVAAAVLLLVALLPLMLVVALLVACTSRGGAFFVQSRVGVDGRLFPMIKFRSMVVDADARVDALITGNDSSGPLFKLRRDPRVTRVGRFLRKTSIDELPQLVNVISGQMSLVGPRPALPREVAQYSSFEMQRLSVKPGITGLWQVSGRSDLAWEAGVRLDLLYVEHWSLRADLKIMARTVGTLLRTRGAY